MSLNRRVAMRYATALMDLANERGILDGIAEDMHSIETTIHSSRELKLVLLSPIVRPDRKLGLLHEIFGKRFQQVTLAFVDLLVRKGRAEYLLATAEEFLTMLDMQRNVLRATITSAVNLNVDEQKQIQAKLESITGKTIRAEFNIDPALRGGFVARMGDRMIDASLKHQLEVLREEFRRGGTPVLN